MEAQGARRVASEAVGSRRISSGPARTPDALDPADSWDGLQDAAERRRRQNRVHQRAARHRKALEKLASRPAPGQVFIFEHPEQPRPRQPRQGETATAHEGPGRVEPTLTAACHPLRPAVPTPSSGSTTRLIPPVIPYMAEGDSRMVVFNFPISPDHRLITLVQYNTLRATLTNFALTAPLSRFVLPPECAAIYQIPADRLFPLPAAVPPTLAPTALQLATPHEPWVDAVPDPDMRDNLLRHMDVLDQDDLCCDLVGGLFEGFNEIEMRGIIVWNDPWRPEGWEMSDGFARKWGFLLKGCHRMVESTNRWRDQRGDDRLVIEV